MLEDKLVLRIKILEYKQKNGRISLNWKNMNSKMINWTKKLKSIKLKHYNKNIKANFLQDIVDKLMIITLLSTFIFIFFYWYRYQQAFTNFNLVYQGTGLKICRHRRWLSEFQPSRRPRFSSRLRWHCPLGWTLHLRCIASFRLVIIPLMASKLGRLVVNLTFFEYIWAYSVPFEGELKV